MIELSSETDPFKEMSGIGDEIPTTFTALIELFGDESIVVNVLFPFLGSGHYIVIAGINRRMKYLYEKYLRDQWEESNREYVTNGSIVFQSLSLTAFYIKENNISKANDMMCNYVALYGNLDLLKLLYDEGFRLNTSIFGLCRYAALGGHLEILKWARANECQWNCDICSNAAEGGHLKVLQWARENGCDWNSNTCANAALGGHLDVLQWARANGCSWNSRTAASAAYGGHLKVLQWARNHGCKWDSHTCASAAYGGHLEVLKWARKNGCEWDQATCSEAARGGQLETLKWARENGCEWNRYECIHRSRRCCHFETLYWILGIRA